mgnify:CR=1 FL=1
MLICRKISGIRNTFSFLAVLVAVVWLSGLFSGAYILCRTAFVSLLYSSSFLRTSIVGLGLSMIVPLLLSHIVLKHLKVYFILPVVFLKALTFICCYGSLSIIFRNAGWLISGMIMFTDFFLIVLLLFQWFNAATGKTYSCRFNVIVYVFIPIAVGCFDYFFVSPYAAMLLNY